MKNLSRLGVLFALTLAFSTPVFGQISGPVGTVEFNQATTTAKGGNVKRVISPKAGQAFGAADNLDATAFDAVFVRAVSSVNAKTTGTTNLLTVPAGRTFYCTQIKIETTAATAITAGAAITVGSANTAADSILASTSLANSPVVNGYETFSPKAGALRIPATGVVRLTIGTAATGTSQVLKVHLAGYYQ
jgi:hypothetical protein